MSRTRNRLRGMTGKGKVTEASVLRIVTPAELKRLRGESMVSDLPNLLNVSEERG